MVAWRKVRAFPIFTEHNWIEPGETIYDDLVLGLAVPEPVLTMFEARLVWAWSTRQGHVVVFARKVVPVEQSPDRAKEEVT